MTAVNRAKWTMAALLATVSAMTAPVPAADFWDVSIIDDQGATGQGASLAILASGQPAVSFFRFADFTLQYSSFDGAAWHAETVDTDLGLADGHTSLAILPSGDPAISYYHGAYRDLKYAFHDASGWHPITVESLGRVGRFNSLAILPTGQPAISYYDELNGDLKYATFAGAQWVITIIDSDGDVGQYSSIAVLPSGQPAVSYYDATNRALKYAWFDGATWQKAVVDDLGYAAGTHTSLAILPSGEPGISYQAQPAAPPVNDKDLRFAFFDGTWHRTVADAYQDVSVGEFTSLVVLPDGEPAISYFDVTHRDLKFARRGGAGWVSEIVDAGGDVGQHSSLAILPSGRPAIACYDADHTDLIFATPPVFDPAPVGVATTFTATAWTQFGGDTVVENGPAYNQGVWPVGIDFAFAASSVNLDGTEDGHLRGTVGLFGHDGFDIGGLISCQDATGTISAAVQIGTSAAHPAGSPLEAELDVIVRGDPGDIEYFLLQLFRDTTLLAQIDPSAPASQTVTVFAGESLTLELYADEEDFYGDGEQYDGFFEFRLVMIGQAAIPGDVNGDGVVDVLDMLEVLAAWGPCAGCPADINGDGVVNVLDLLEVLANWT